MTLAIVVPTLNRSRKLARFAKCLSRQTYKDFHVYIVDSGSKDGTHEMCFTFPIPYTFIQATPDDWWSAATNIGIKKALKDGCEIILTINDDAIIMDDYLEKFLAVFKKNNLRICANRIDFADRPGVVWALGSYSTFGSPYLFQLAYNEYWVDDLPTEVLSSEIIPTMAVCGDGILIHKSVFEEIGLFEEKFTPHAHGDSEFALRANKANIPVYVALNVVLYNDVYNTSEQAIQVDRRSFFKKFNDVFFSKKSDCYWRPIFYVTLKYAPSKHSIQTLLRYFLFKYYVFFLPDFLKVGSTFYDLNRTKFGIKFLAKKTVRFFLKKFAMWVFDFQKYDQETCKILLRDKKMKKSLEHIYKLTHYI